MTAKLSVLVFLIMSYTFHGVTCQMNFNTDICLGRCQRALNFYSLFISNRALLQTFMVTCVDQCQDSLGISTVSTTSTTKSTSTRIDTSTSTTSRSTSASIPSVTMSATTATTSTSAAPSTTPTTSPSTAPSTTSTTSTSTAPSKTSTTSTSTAPSTTSTTSTSTAPSTTATTSTTARASTASTSASTTPSSASTTPGSHSASTSSSTTPRETTVSPSTISSTASASTLTSVMPSTATSSTVGTLSCGQSPYTRMYKIFGGHPAEQCEFPWLVDLKISSLGDHCAGSIVDSRHVVTAAHCLTDKYTKAVVSPADIVVRAGSSNRDNARGYYVQKVTVNSRFDLNTYDYDVAVLTLSESLVFNNCTAPICLPSVGDDVRKTRFCYAAGWGQTETSSSTNELQKVLLPLVDNAKCAETYGDKITDQKLCAGDFEYGRIDTCQGDSGGPLMCFQDERYVMHGIVSFGYECGLPKKPGVYIKVANSEILSFIHSNLH